MIKIYTDGSATKTRYGWGYVFIDDEGVSISSGTEDDSTNQRMELTAAINGLNHWKLNYYNDFNDSILVYSDSAYLVNCYKQKWYESWQSNGWVNSKKEPVANQDLWEQLIPYFNNPAISFVKVQGHTGDKYNEMANDLACGTFKSSDLLTSKEENEKLLKDLVIILNNFKNDTVDIYQSIAMIKRLFNE